MLHYNLDYTEGERDWMESTIVIDAIQRKDDGLYECKVGRRLIESFPHKQKYCRKKKGL